MSRRFSPLQIATGLRRHPVSPGELRVPRARVLGSACHSPFRSRHLCRVGTLSLGFLCAFPGRGSCCSFCPESLFSVFCLVKSLFFKLCFNVTLTSLPSPVRINCSLLLCCSTALITSNSSYLFRHSAWGKGRQRPLSIHLLVSRAQGLPSKCLLKPTGTGGRGLGGETGDAAPAPPIPAL